MKLRIMCPGCGRKARIPAIAAGNVRCTTCGTVTDIATASKARQLARAAGCAA
jgi:ribosomal protein S27E